MGVGKTTVCRLMNEKLESSVFLDGDWCWNASPFTVNDETKKMVCGNICYLLNSFIHCTAYKNIVFCWVMHEQGIIDGILKELDTRACSIKTVSLICDEKSLVSRLEKDVEAGIRKADVIERSVARIPLYEKLNTIKINTSNKTPDKAADEIIKL